MVAELDRFARTNGLGMVHPDVQEFLPPQDEDRNQQLAQEAEDQLKVIIEQHGVREALGVNSLLFDAAVRRIAGFHALAYDLGVYKGSLVGYFVKENEADREGFFLLIAESNLDLKLSEYDTEVAIASKHGGLEERHRSGLESRRLFNLRGGLTMLMHDSGLTVYTQSFPDGLLKPTQSRQELFVFSPTAFKPQVTYIGELIPARP